MNERELIDRIRHLLPEDAPGLIRAIGDDCAVISKTDDLVWLLTMDTLMESVHFDLSWHSPFELGRKAVTVNVSDISAMGGTPVFSLLSLGLPTDFDGKWAAQLSRGIADACQEYGCLLIGGDTVCSPGGVALSLTVIGEMKRDLVLYRNRAKPGDTVWVSGPLGLAGAGLDLCKTGTAFDAPAMQPLLKAHRDPRARLRMGAFLAETGLVHAMMDLSDGLATDLAHLCVQSGVGARVFAGKLPGYEVLEAPAQLLGRQPLSWMISSGEDYELLFTTSGAVTDEFVTQLAEHGFSAYPVGTLTKGKSVLLVQEKSDDGTVFEQDISYQGYGHFEKR